MGGPEGIADDVRLLRLQAVTDTALSRLAVADLLDELLERVTDLLDADTAAILLMDAHSRQLVATAAKGLEEEVRAGFRVSVGRGFAGRVAATRRPVVIADVTPDDVVNPILLDKGIRSLLGVPMMADGEVVGVLHIGSLSPRVFTADDVQLMQLVADRASLAGQIRSHKLDQSAALALQRSLLPATLPRIEGVDLAARYVPGHAYGIGGDWYDVFTLPSGWLGVVIGDVSGHGLPSAVVMGRIRSALRAYALVCDDPAEVLTLLDRKVHHFETGVLTTALYAMISPDRETVRLSSAGHLPPILAAPDGPGVVLDIPVGPPLGVGRPSIGRRTATVAFPAGGLFVCYTDGLVEHRGEVIDEGIGRLADAVRHAGADAVCGTIMSRTASELPTDDIALLVVRRPFVECNKSS
ncbi:cyclic diguanylate phosphodiesterase [Actinoplanes sp. NBRC 14428]|uniref:Serine phosphatase RsbU (Regulator of sigma subunit) n=1 Tax=Pseudosporangium ferrugineum TaxID=439699 RepID=A0A2T0SET8_9ACTN|nr:GAF domain-containing SpoIIE family protein phosphatase [Pseudosporangium ferrugineum]PRY31911.1 serine phosphatase RsbU (regulator of sigma subunit) [Pseudosporangium ferrugineum]BCJ49851.1 cyclic diguanylate phosphodiesterase [Actinoplanes sp. NBRC 14428]